MELHIFLFFPKYACPVRVFTDNAFFVFFFVNSMCSSGLDAMLFDVHFDGVFYFNPLRYENGVIFYLKVSKEKKYDYDRLCMYLKDQLDTNFCGMFFKLPGCDLENGLKIVESNADLESMYAFCESYGKLEMYLSHIPQNQLYQYYHTNIVFDESVNEATSKLRILGIATKDAGNMSYDELVSWG